MNLRVCSPQLGISPDSNLGGEVHDREMIQALDQLGVEIFIILPMGKKYPSLKHAKIYFLPTPFVWPPYLFNILILPYLFWIYRRHHFNVLRVHSPLFVGPAAISFKFFFPKVKLVATYHHLDGVKTWLDDFLIKNFDLVIAVSRKTKEELCDSKVIIVPNGISKNYHPDKKNIGLLKKYSLGNKKVILYLGQLIERKNISFLFKVIRILPKNYVLIIAGDGPLRRHLEQIAPERVIFTGKVPEEEKVDYYNLADLFVYPSKKEGFGLSISEALACGLPVITLPGLVENMDVIEAAENPKLWADTIIVLKDRKKSAYLSNYSWEKSAKQYISLIENSYARV